MRDKQQLLNYFNVGNQPKTQKFTHDLVRKKIKKKIKKATGV